MIETYKEHNTNDESEIILYSTSHKSSSNRDKDEDNGSSDNEDGMSKNRLEETSFNIRSLNIKGLNEHGFRNKVLNDFTREGDKLSMQLLMTQAFLFQLIHFAIIPHMFEFT